MLGPVLIGRFIDVAGDPAGLLTRVYEFLEINAGPKYIGEVASKRVNPTESAGIPPVLRARLEELFGEEVELLKSRELI